MKAILCGILFFVWVGCGLCDPLFSEAVRQSQSVAVQAYPDLGVKGSLMNDLFAQLYREHGWRDPEFFKNDQWPLQLAKECAQKLPQELARIERSKADMKASDNDRHVRELAFKDRPVPLPAKTPYDLDPYRRKNYVSGYECGYRWALVWLAREIPADPELGLANQLGQRAGATAALCYLVGVNPSDVPDMPDNKISCGREILRPKFRYHPVYGPGY